MNKNSDAAAGVYPAIAKKFLNRKGVTESKMFGGPVLKVNGKVFAFPYKGNFVFKLPLPTIEKLVAAKKGEYFDPGHGRPSKAWISVRPIARAQWSRLTDQALSFVQAEK